MITLHENKKVSLRGLSAVSEKVIWVSGSGGTVGKSVDGGETWRWMNPPTYEKREFRDIYAFDSSNAVVIAIAEPAVILQTKDGGTSWHSVFKDTTKGMFLDAIDFMDNDNGIVIGDPINHVPYVAYTTDGGASWQRYTKGLPAFIDEEAFFAASGTNVHLESMKNGEPQFIMVSGGMQSNIYTNTSIDSLPFSKGKNSAGANSIAILNDKVMAVAGGDFSIEKDSMESCFISHDGGKTWQQPVIAPHGYRSAIIYKNKNEMVTCGLNGVDVSGDGGLHWELVSKTGYHVVQKSRKGNAIFLAGGNGRIAKLRFN